jgi:alpha-tubulin suppressor-like RCC1 family protein
MSLQNIRLNTIQSTLTNKYTAVIDSTRTINDQNGKAINLNNNSSNYSLNIAGSNLIIASPAYINKRDNIYNINYLKDTTYKYAYNNTDTKSIFERYLKQYSDMNNTLITFTKNKYTGIQKLTNFGNCFSLIAQNICTTIAYNHIVKVVCSDYHSVFLENTGYVLACGYNKLTRNDDPTAGIAGITGTTNVAGIVWYPQYVLHTNNQRLSNIANIFCSIYSTLFLESTGNVLACGNNNHNSTKFGITGTTTSSGVVWYVSYVLDTTGVTGSKLSNIVNICCSDYHTVFLENTGNVLACGYNNADNTYGYGITGTQNSIGIVWYPQYVLINISTKISNIKCIVCSKYHTVFLENTGNVLACGYNNTNDAKGITSVGSTESIFLDAWFEFENNLNDSSGNNIILTKNNISPTNFGFDSEFKTTGSYSLYMNYTAQLTTSNLSLKDKSFNISFDLQPMTPLDGNIAFICQKKNDSTTSGTLFIGLKRISTNIYSIIMSNTKKDGTHLFIESQTTYSPNVSGYMFNALGSLVNLKFIYNKATLQCQIIVNNGNTTTKTLTSAFEIDDTASLLTIGSSGFDKIPNLNNSDFYGFKGYIDNMKIYNTHDPTSLIATVYYPKYVVNTTGTIGSKLSNITNVVCSENHTLFLENTGNVLAVGTTNVTGTSIGTTNTIQTYPKYVLGTTGTSTLSNIIEIVCSKFHTVFLDNNGKVYACGYNRFENAITGTATAETSTPYIIWYPQNVLANSGSGQINNIIDINCSEFNTILLENTGNVLSYGFSIVATGTKQSNDGTQTIWYPLYVLDTSGTTNTRLNNINSIVCSKNHTIFLNNKGNIFTCGFVSNGITGTTSSSSLVNVYYPKSIIYNQLPITYHYTKTSIIKVVCSNYHTVFLENTGRVLACGTNDGTAGITGTRNDNNIVRIPEYVLGTAQGNTYLSNIINIVCSIYNTIFLENTGKVLACGVNTGQVGITGTRNDNNIVRIPEYVLGNAQGNTYLSNITSIVCSKYHIVFLENTGKVLACGTNDGLIGITGTQNNNNIVRIPQYLLGTNQGNTYLSNIISIACSIYNTIFLENTGKVLACGVNTGQFGITGTRNDNNIVRIPEYVLGNAQGNTYLSNITSIVCSECHIVFLENTGRVLACGNNYNNTGSGILAGITGTQSNNNKMVRIPEYVLGTAQKNTYLSNIINIVCCNTLTIFLENTGKVLACGNNWYSDPFARGITGTSTNTLAIVYIPNYVLGTRQGNTYLSNIKNISCSDYNAVFIENSGKILINGTGNINGTPGQGITGTKTSSGAVIIPEYVLGTSQDNTYLINITNVVHSDYNIVFLENTGKIIACGYNNNAKQSSGSGITGTQNNDNIVYIPQYVQNINNGITDFIPGNNCYFCIENSNMTSNVVRANFNNDFGKLGIMNNFGSLTSSIITSNIYSYANYIDKYVVNHTGTGLLSNVKTISCGNYHTLFLLNNGNVYSCGYNNYGQLGLATYAIQSIGKPTAVRNGTNIKTISCGLYHSVILNNSGDAYSCGLNNYGQLGLGNNNNYNIPTKITVTGIIFSDVECGGWHTVLQTTTNTAYSMGLNDGGQLATFPNGNNQSSPLIVSNTDASKTNLTNIKFIRCKNKLTLWVLDNNNIYFSGNNYNFPAITYTASSTTIVDDIYTNIFSDEIYVKISETI